MIHITHTTDNHVGQRVVKWLLEKLTKDYEYILEGSIWVLGKTLSNSALHLPSAPALLSVKRCSILALPIRFRSFSVNLCCPCQARSPNTSYKAALLKLRGITNVCEGRKLILGFRDEVYIAGGVLIEHASKFVELPRARARKLTTDP